MANRLITLQNLDELTTLRALYMTHGLTQILGYQTLNNYISWFEREPFQKHINVYTLPEVWKKSGLFLIVDRYQLMVNVLDTKEAKAQLKLALPQLDWSRGYKMTGAPSIHYETIVKILTGMRVHIDFVRLHVMHMPREQVLNIEVSLLPEEFEFRPLTITDAAIVNEIWYSRTNGSLEFIKRLITYNHSMGIALKSTGELIAWCIRCNLGLLGMLHVKEAYRGHGLAIQIVHYLSRQIAKSGDDVSTMINDKNSASVKLFKKLKFNEIGITFILKTKRHDEIENWSEELEARES